MRPWPGDPSPLRGCCGHRLCRCPCRSRVGWLRQLAGLAFRTNNATVLVVVALFALGFAVLDGRELLHQLDEDRTGLAVLAGVIAVLYLGAAGIATKEARA
jgi:hypothetical protein